MKRLSIFAIAALALAACASGPNVGPRPPEGPGPGGTDFGFWNRDSDGSVDNAFRTQMMRKYNEKDWPAARVTLEKDGFTCRDGNRPDGRPVPELSCERIFFYEDFYHTWWVEFWPNEPEPRAHYTRTATRNPLSDVDKRKRQPPR